MYTRAEDYAHQYKLKSSRNKYYGDCPACDYQGFSLWQDGERIKWRNYACSCTWEQIVEQFKSDGLWGRSSCWSTSPVTMPTPKPKKEPEKRQYDPQALARKLWEESQPAENTPVEAYLRQRKYIGPVPKVIRYLSWCKYSDTEAYYPAMLSAVQKWPASEIVAVHRTYLNRVGVGKAEVGLPKKWLGPCEGGAVQIALPTETLAIAEGIESALSFYQAEGIPTWSALSAWNMQSLVLPDLPLAQNIIICSDYDPTGLRITYEMADKWHRQGRSIHIVRANARGMDMNDLLSQ